MEYRYKVKISTGEVLYLRELTLGEYKNLQKVCIESDISIFEDFIVNLIKNLTDIDRNFDTIDLYFIVLNIMRSSAFDTKSFLTYINGKGGYIDVSIDKFIDVIYDKCEDLSNTRNKMVEIPNFIASGAYIDPLSDNYIKALYMDGKRVEIDDVENFLPANITKNIRDYVEDILKTFDDVVFARLNSKNGKEYDLGFKLDRNYILNFLKNIIKSDLKELYEALYYAKRELNISFNEYDDITLQELKMYINLHQKEIEKQNERNNSEDNILPS